MYYPGSGNGDGAASEPKREKHNPESVARVPAIRNHHGPHYVQPPGQAPLRDRVPDVLPAPTPEGELFEISRSATGMIVAPAIAL